MLKAGHSRQSFPAKQQMLLSIAWLNGHRDVDNKDKVWDNVCRPSPGQHFPHHFFAEESRRAKAATRTGAFKSMWVDEEPPLRDHIATERATRGKAATASRSHQKGGDEESQGDQPKQTRRPPCQPLELANTHTIETRRLFTHTRAHRRDWLLILASGLCALAYRRLSRAFPRARSSVALADRPRRCRGLPCSGADGVSPTTTSPQLSSPEPPGDVLQPLPLRSDCSSSSYVSRHVLERTQHFAMTPSEFSSIVCTTMLLSTSSAIPCFRATLARPNPSDHLPSLRQQFHLGWVAHTSCFLTPAFARLTIAAITLSSSAEIFLRASLTTACQSTSSKGGPNCVPRGAPTFPCQKRLIGTPWGLRKRKRQIIHPRLILVQDNDLRHIDGGRHIRPLLLVLAPLIPELRKYLQRSSP